MRRALIIGTSLLLAGGVLAAAGEDRAARRAILVCASSGAAPAVKAAAKALAESPESAPALKALIGTQGAGPVVRETSEALIAGYDRCAYNHLVVIGLRSGDPLLEKAWEHYVSVDEKSRSLYAQGWGHLRGDIGIVESDRNPFLHSRRVSAAPFETVIIKLTGTSEKGVLAAVEAFRAGMLNGLAPAGKVERLKRTVLDLDPLPLPAPLAVPDTLPPSGAVRAGWSQAPANEYRAYADLGQPEPLQIWRCKFLFPDSLGRAGIAGWMAGLHRMAYGNAVTMAEFRTPEEAQKVALLIGSTKGFKRSEAVAGAPVWLADQPTDERMPKPLGSLAVLAVGRCVLLSSLPPETLAVFLIQTSGRDHQAGEAGRGSPQSLKGK